MLKKIISITFSAILLCNQNNNCSVIKAARAAATTVASPELISQYQQTLYFDKIGSRIWLAVPFLIPFLSPLIIKAFASRPSRTVEQLVNDEYKKINKDGHLEVRHTWSDGSIAKGIGNGVIAIDRTAAHYLESSSKKLSKDGQKYKAAMPALLRHEFGHIEEQHFSKIFLTLGLLNIITYFVVEKLAARQPIVNLFAQPTSQLGFMKLNLLLNLKEMLTMLPFFCCLFPLCRYTERRADDFAIAHTSNHEELEAVAQFFEAEARSQKLQPDSFRTKYWVDPAHPSIFERIDKFRAAAQKQSKQPPVAAGEGKEQPVKPA